MTEEIKPHRPFSRVIGTGKAVPEQVLTNHDLEQIVDTSDEWIVTRTGIKERRIIQKGERTSDYCTRAATEALTAAGVEAKEIDTLIIATISGDMRFPSTALFVQDKLGCVNAAAWDVSATCSGFLYSLHQADTMIAAGRSSKALVIGAETLTPLCDWTDRSTCVLFGDGAGAVVLERSDDERGLLSTYIGSNGNQTELLYCIGTGTAGSLNGLEYAHGDTFLRMSGNEVFRHAVRTLYRAAQKTVKMAGITTEQVDMLIPHQANKRIIDATAERLGIPPERVFVNIHKYGNTSTASIPIALDEAIREGHVQPGQIVVAVAFGGGFTWGGAAIRI